MNAEPPSSLCRPEVADAKRQRLHGQIVLAQPVEMHAVALLLFAVVAALAGWIMLGEYARTETAKGILVTDMPTAKVIAIRPGVVSRLSVREGELVRQGEHLATVQVEARPKGAAARSPTACPL